MESSKNVKWKKDLLRAPSLDSISSDVAATMRVSKWSKLRLTHFKEFRRRGGWIHSRTGRLRSADPKAVATLSLLPLLQRLSICDVRVPLQGRSFAPFRCRWMGRQVQIAHLPYAIFLEDD
ncbi:hypothetical protein NPIL_198491 [Nephila pilipes]|uniref:Uncharacterized protein n=1 Tax=Nephila pilipes TaxID=299642 RepID=A0A8X6PRE9_NEPPI|nr:hypothetical protein NPIL_198491 [Nephila pilipes]